MKPDLSGLFDGLEEIETKECKICHHDLPVTSFSMASGGNYRRTECRACEKKLNAVRNKIKKSVVPPGKDYKCPICNRGSDEVANNGGKKSGTWCCDHDHLTETFRGWLCHDCNRAIGSMNDSVDRLQAAIYYLEETK